MKLADIQTPAAIIDVSRMNRNIERMQRRMDALGVRFRPHVKTSKCLAVIDAQRGAGARGITVSTLKEAEHCFAHGVLDILYAVGMAPTKLARAADLRRRGCELKLVTDTAASAHAMAEFGRQHVQSLDVLIEIDTDGHRSGIGPDDPQLLKVARVLHEGGMNLCGVMTHAGSSYGCHTPEALRTVAERERALCVLAAERIRDSGLPCPTVSVGSTPTALAADHLDGVTEVRAGVYVFFDLCMLNVGVCAMEDLALSVLSTVIGHQAENGWAIIDGGWMALSRDRSTQQQIVDFGYGQICSRDGVVIPDYFVGSVNQEHGIVSRAGIPDADIVHRFPVGTQLRVLPNHACATGAQFSEYQALNDSGTISTWSRINGW
jgi:D-serine deaminase-like pyridoxal phosphate-dependent protein